MELGGVFAKQSFITININTNKPYEIDNISEILKNEVSGSYLSTNLYEYNISEKNQKMITGTVIYAIIRNDCNIFNIKHI